MKIVIDIPEEIYQYMQSRFMYQGGDETYLSLSEKSGIAIKNGTVLPKGYGRLIDADAYLRNTPIKNADDTWIKESYVYESIINAPTVIEADKEDNTRYDKIKKTTYV